MLSHRSIPSGEMRYGDHAMLLYSSAEERMEAVASFVAEGLKRNDQVLCVDEGVGASVMQRLVREMGNAARRNGQIVIENSANTYLQGGCFSADRMKTHYRAASKRATAEGFNGLRVAANMSWAAGKNAKTFLPLTEYEASLEEALLGERVMVVCEYDARAFDIPTLDALEQAHTLDLRPQPLYSSQRLSIERGFDPPRLTFIGELDVAARHALPALLANFAAFAGRTPIVDLRGLTYLDAGSVGAFVAASRQSESGLEIIVNSRLALVFRVLSLTLPDSLEVREMGVDAR